MKHLPFLFIAFSSLVVAAPAFAQCRNGWCKAICHNRDGDCYYVKVISKDYPIYKVLENSSSGMKTVFFDCQQYKWKNEGSSGGWTQFMPDSIGESVLETACGM